MKSFQMSYLAVPPRLDLEGVLEEEGQLGLAVGHVVELVQVGGGEGPNSTGFNGNMAQNGSNCGKFSCINRDHFHTQCH